MANMYVAFDPVKVASLEVKWWQAHNDKDRPLLIQILILWLQELYGINQEDAQNLVRYLAKAVAFHDRRQWQEATREMVGYYEHINKILSANMDVEKAGELEVGWWKLHDELEFVEDKTPLAKHFSKLYANVYSINEATLQNCGVLKAEATREHDYAESSDTENDEISTHWQNAEKYLNNFYAELKILVK